jgi:hypothetical protein
MAITAQATPAIQQANTTASGAPLMTRTTANPDDINTIVGGMVDRSPWHWWDTYQNPLASPAVAVASSITFFQVPIGQPDPVTAVAKTKLQTNMTQSGQFSPPYCCVLQQIGFHINSDDRKADIDSFFNKCYVQFSVLGKVFSEGRLWMYPDGFGLMGSPNPTGAAADQSWTNGFPAPQAGFRLGKYARYIPPLTQFAVTLFFPGTPPTLANNFNLVCFLDGLTDLPVQ